MGLYNISGRGGDIQLLLPTHLAENSLVALGHLGQHTRSIYGDSFGDGHRPWVSSGVHSSGLRVCFHWRIHRRFDCGSNKAEVLRLEPLDQSVLAAPVAALA